MSNPGLNQLNQVYVDIKITGLRFGAGTAFTFEITGPVLRNKFIHPKILFWSQILIAALHLKSLAIYQQFEFYCFVYRQILAGQVLLLSLQTYKVNSGFIAQSIDRYQQVRFDCLLCRHIKAVQVLFCSLQTYSSCSGIIAQFLDTFQKVSLYCLLFIHILTGQV